MTKIVVSWRSPGYSESSDYTICFNYEAEAFYCELEEQLKRYLVELESWRNLRKIWEKEAQKIKEKYRGTGDKKNLDMYMEVRQRQPLSPNAEWKFGNYTFDLHDFIESGRASMPDIQTLNEWFEENLEN